MTKGFPVIIVEKGGIPVVNDPNAAPCFAVDNGFGTPITIVHKDGTPLNVQSGPHPSDTPPQNVSPPTVSAAVPMLNVVDVGAPGVWTSDTPITYAFQWQSSDDGTAWEDIAGANGANYAPAFEVRQKYLRLGVSATNDAGTIGPVYSSQTAKVAPYDFEIYAGVYGGIGGDHGYSKNSFGSLLSAEPVPGFDLSALYSRPEGYANLAFEGDCVNILTGLTILLDPAPTPWGPPLADWKLSGGETQTDVSPSGQLDITQPTTVTWAKT